MDYQESYPRLKDMPRDEDGFIRLIPKHPIGRSIDIQNRFIHTGTKEIVLHHGHISICNYKMGDNREFEKSLSIWNKMTFRYELIGGYYVPEYKEFRINRGYDLYRLKNFFPDYPMRVMNDAFIGQESTIELYTPPRSDIQRVALTFMTRQGMYGTIKQSQQLIDMETGNGKAMPDDTPILTPDGWKRLDSLKVGDIVYGYYGQEVSISAIYPQGMQDTYRITLEDGRTTRCNIEHLWYVCDNSHRLPYVVTLQEIVNNPDTVYYIPVTIPTNNERITKWVKLTNIEKLPEQTSQRCILLADDDHLYIAENYIVTHNTYCGVATTAYWKKKVIIFVPFSKLLNEWRDAFTSFTSLNKDDIMIIQGSDACDKILKGKCKDIQVFICSTDTVASYQKRYGNIQTIEMLRATGAYIKIIDEIHRDIRAVSMIEALSNFHTNYYMSASPGRAEQKENWIFKTLFKNVPHFGGDFNTKEERHITVMIKKFRWTPTPQQIRAMVNNKTGLNTKSYERELINSPEWQRQSYNDAIMVLLKWAKGIMGKDKRLMLMAQSIETLYYIQKLAEEVFPGETSVYYGGMKKGDKEAALEKRIIVATDSSLGTGANIPNLQVLIYCSTYSNWLTARQISGRLRELKDGSQVVYIELLNTGYMKTMRQFDKRKSELINRSKTGKLFFVD